MLVGIIFIFIILLMIVANNFQQATETVKKQKSDDMVAKINDARNKALDQARNEDMSKMQRDMFYESRERLMRAIKQALLDEGVMVTMDVAQGVMRMNDSILFAGDDYQVSESAKHALVSMAGILGMYLPCASATKDPVRLVACNELNLPADDGLDAVFIEYHPDSKASTEQKWLLSVQRSLAIFRGLTQYESYLDKELKNTAGVPILNVTARQGRRQGKKAEPKNSPFSNTIEFKFLMREPAPEDILRMRAIEDAVKPIDPLVLQAPLPSQAHP
jgi:hypothetical protein